MNPTESTAILVGIERYTAGQGWDLPGPAEDVFTVAEYLLNRGIPAGRIQLYLAALDEPAAHERAGKLGLGFNEPTREALYRLFTGEGKTFRGGPLLVYWAGHGIVTPEGDRRLFYADARKEAYLNLDVEQLIALLRSYSIEQQIIVLDTCASFQPENITAPFEEIPRGRCNPRTKLWRLTAAAPGQFARTKIDGKGGEYTSLLVGALRQQNAWPPDLRQVSEFVQQKLKELPVERQQSAGLFEFVDSDDSGTRFGRSAQPPAPPVRRVRLKVPATNFEMLVVFDRRATLGRSPECDFPLVRASRQVSHIQAVLEYDEQKKSFRINDRGSTNGTMVNGRTLSAPTILKTNNVVGMPGSLRFEFAEVMGGEGKRERVGGLIFRTEKAGVIARYLLAPAKSIYFESSNSLTNIPNTPWEAAAILRVNGASLEWKSGGEIFNIVGNANVSMGGQPLRIEVLQ